MGHNLVISPSETFVKEVRNALNHLYDPDFLRTSPMVEIFGLSERFDTPTSLQNILTQAIEGMKPGAFATNKSHMQGVYDILLYRYVQQFNQDEIANQLGISVRHLRRQQNLAVYELAQRLWQEYNPGNLPYIRTEKVITDSEEAEKQKPMRVTEELTWLQDSSSQVTTDIRMALRDIEGLIEPLAEQRQVRVEFPKNASGLVLVHPVAFQQILLTLLSTAIRLGTNKEV